MNILIIGGSGYIGGVTAQLAHEAGHKVTVADISEGQSAKLPADIKFIQGDILDRGFVKNLFKSGEYDSVMHFAALIVVGESMQKPFEYFNTNTVGALNCIDAAANAGVGSYVFSSTAATYGEPTKVPIQETDPTKPVNPYGFSKLLSEQLLDSYQITHNLNWVALRYFNVVGAYKGIGTDYPFTTHIVPVLLEKIAKKEPITINGNDYGTPDGTCIRDYVHVVDIARAHLQAAEKIAQKQQINQPINLSTGEGNSVKEVVDTFNQTTGINIPIKYGPRRAGDPAKLVASNERAKELLNWQPRYSLKQAIQDHYNWFNQKGRP